jgi:hypothetical protein
MAPEGGYASAQFDLNRTQSVSIVEFYALALNATTLRSSAGCAVGKNGRVIGVEMTLAIPQPTEWQPIGNEIDAAFVFAGTDFVNAGRQYSR